jgi:hypothetical protein
MPAGNLAHYDAPLPKYVKNEMRAYLRCGIFALAPPSGIRAIDRYGQSEYAAITFVQRFGGSLNLNVALICALFALVGSDSYK